MWQMWQIHNRILDQLDASIFNQSDDRTAAEDWRELRKCQKIWQYLIETEKQSLLYILHVPKPNENWFHFLFNQNKIIFMLFWTKKRVLLFVLNQVPSASNVFYLNALYVGWIPRNIKILIFEPKLPLRENHGNYEVPYIF